MNIFCKTMYSNKPFINEMKLYNKRFINSIPSKKLNPSFSCTNYYSKSKNIPIFLKTINNFNFDKLNKIKQHEFQLKKIKLKKSSSSIFQNNDVDLVRNLNFDSIVQFNKNTQLRESLIDSLRGNFNDENNDNEKKENEKEEVQLPTLSKLSKYKSYEIIQNHKKKIKIELSEQLQKELINKLKSLRNDCQMKKIEKDKIFSKIKSIEEQLEEIDAENYYYKEKYKKQINDISKIRKESPEKKQEILKARLKSNFDKKKKKINKGSLMDIFKVDRKENNNKLKINNNNISQDTNVSNIKNESIKIVKKN